MLFNSYKSLHFRSCECGDFLNEMEIKFLLPDGTSVSNPYDIPVELQEGHINFYVVLKSLEFRKNVVDSILGTRKNHSIPEDGYDPKYLKLFYDTKSQDKKYSKMKVAEDKTVDYSFFITKSFKWNQILGISNSFESRVTHEHALADIILFNTVIVKHGFPKIYVDHITDKLLGEQIHIVLNTQFSKKELVDFIENNYTKKIKPGIDSLSKSDSLLLRKTDIDILSLRERKQYTFPQIADHMGKNFFEPEVRRAYHWAKEKIDRNSNSVTDDDYLTAREKVIFRLHDLDKLTFKDIAVKLGPAKREKVDSRTIEAEFDHAQRKIYKKAFNYLSKTDPLNPREISISIKKALDELM